MEWILQAHDSSLCSVNASWNGNQDGWIRRRPESLHDVVLDAALSKTVQYSGCVPIGVEICWIQLSKT